MKRETLSDALNLLEDAIIEEAYAARSRKRRRWLKIAAAAACLALVGYAGIRAFLQKAPGRPELPLLSATEETACSMGFEGYMAYNISELASGNPWQEGMRLSTLPVYRNQAASSERIDEAGWDRMRALLTDIASRLGLDAEVLSITDNAPDEQTKKIITEKLEIGGGQVPDGYFDPTALVAKAPGVTIEVDRSMTADISFEPAVSLPEGYDFSHFASREEMTKTAGYLQNAYKELIGMDCPQISLDGGDYNIYLQQGYQISFFDADGGDTSRIINYHFNRVAFYCNDEGKLFLVRVFRQDLSEKVGDYPVISVKEATQLLKAGNYITTVPYAMPGIEYVAKAELIYRTGSQETYFMPYYRFYAELPEEERGNGLKTYGAYYVPAVESAYIAHMPVWDGSFH